MTNLKVQEEETPAAIKDKDECRPLRPHAARPRHVEEDVPIVEGIDAQQSRRTQAAHPREREKAEVEGEKQEESRSLDSPIIVTHTPHLPLHPRRHRRLSLPP